MRRIAWIVMLASLSAGCYQTDANPDWNPETEYPAWAYDAPFYYRPTEELAVGQTLGNGIDVYYSPSEYFFIRHPGGAQTRGAPRMALWTTNSETRQWRRKGYYGLEQSHFSFKADGDGPQWIRFVGPAQSLGDVPPGSPHRIYVVDTTQPAIEVLVEKYVKDGSEPGWHPVGTKPPTGMFMKKVPRVSRKVVIGDEIQIRWKVTDANLLSGSVSLAVCSAEFPYNAAWKQTFHSVPPEGTELYRIPEEAGPIGDIKFRVTATDKAGNIGVGVTRTLIVVDADGEPLAVPEMTGPLAMTAITIQDPQPGWPKAGELLRGGTERLLQWLPKDTESHKIVELEFSDDDGKSWRNLAAVGTGGKTVAWTVPGANSKHCRLRIVAAGKEGGRIQLAQTALFTVTTVADGSSTQPRKLELSR